MFHNIIWGIDSSSLTDTNILIKTFEAGCFFPKSELVLFLFVVHKISNFEWSYFELIAALLPILSMVKLPRIIRSWWKNIP